MYSISVPSCIEYDSFQSSVSSDTDGATIKPSGAGDSISNCSLISKALHWLVSYVLGVIMNVFGMSCHIHVKNKDVAISVKSLACSIIVDIVLILYVNTFI